MYVPPPPCAVALCDIPILFSSVLDDNKLLTLPSGERLSIPDNVRIILEVDSLEQATPATVSRCGMIWFSADTISPEMCLEHLIGELRTENIAGDTNLSGDAVPSTQISFLDAIQALVISDDSRSSSLVADALDFALSKTHIMEMTREGLLKSLKSLLVKGIGLAIEYDENHPDFPMVGQHMVSAQPVFRGRGNNCTSLSSTHLSPLLSFCCVASDPRRITLPSVGCCTLFYGLLLVVHPGKCAVNSLICCCVQAA